MVSGVRWLVVCLVCCVVGLVCSPALAFGESSLLAEGSGASSSLGGPLVVPWSPTQGEQVRAGEEAKRSSPEAVVLREESATKYENLDPEQAAKLAGEVFPGVVDELAGGPPKLPAGQSIVSYPTDDAARVELPEGMHGLIESIEPMAIETSPGYREPIDLSLDEVGGIFQPVRSDVALRIPKQLGGGVSLVGVGVSLTPVDAQGSALGGSEGVISGATVFYANTQADMDSVIKPATDGFAADTFLRSVESPERLFFRVGLPAGAGLVSAKDGSGVVEVVDEGAVIATILPPAAQDAAGTSVPVSMSLSGDMLVLSVADHSAEYQYPIEVDPSVVDHAITGAHECVGSEKTQVTGWYFYSTASAIHEGSGCGSVRWYSAEGAYTAGQYAELYYLTQGLSRVYGITAKTDTENAGKTIEDTLYIDSSAGKETPVTLLPYNGGAETTVCVKGTGTCESVTASEKTHDSNAAVLESYVASSSSAAFSATLDSAAVEIEQETGPSVVKVKENTLWENSHSPTTWIGLAEATDPGLGLDNEVWTSPSAPKWSYHSLDGELLGGEFHERICKGVQCPESALYEGYFGYSEEKLPDGEDTLEVKVEDPVGLSATATTKIKVDSTPPHSITLTGMPSGNEFGEGQYVLKASATDGSGTTPSSGVAEIELAVDGKQLGKWSNGCSPGPCTASGEWAISGESYETGKHTLTITATDHAGNVAKEEIPFTVLASAHHASPVAIGPGSVNPVTGDLSLSATDASLGGSGASVSVSRTYNSRQLMAGAEDGEGPLGPQWSISLGAQASLRGEPTGLMTLTSASGGRASFRSKGGGEFTSPTGDTNLTLKEKTVEGAVEFVLSDAAAGSSTTFTQPSGSTGVWKPTVQEGAIATDTTTFAYQTVGGVVEPTEALAPVPSGVSCAPTLNRGCRALTFTYASGTTATGEGSSEWGEYSGRLSLVSMTAWNSSKKEMTTTAVAQYAYDKQGRLRAQWNPQITPALKTTYGYDAEGHVTAVSYAGQQPWLLSYGTSEGDSNTGRLLSVTRPSALTASGDGQAPVNTAVPTLSSSKPVVGTEISVAANGTWSNSPLAYSYQWEDCNASGGECTLIPGAVNQGYYPAKSDEGHTLVAQVTAVNATGSTASVSAATALVASGTPNNPLPTPPNPGTSSVWTVDYHVPVSGSGAPYAMGSSEVSAWGQADDPAEATAIFPPDEPEGWPAQEYKRATIDYLDASRRAVNVATPGGAIATTEYNSNNDIVRTLSPDNRAAALKEGSKSAEKSKLLDTESTYNSVGNELEKTLGPEHTVKLASGSQIQARQDMRYYYEEGHPSGGPYDLVTKMSESALSAGKEEEFRVITTSYSGQSNLGWKLRKPTTVTTEPSGVDIARTTVYEPLSGNVTETRQPAAAPDALTASGFQWEEKGKKLEAGETKMTTAAGERFTIYFNSAGQSVECSEVKGEEKLTGGNPGTGEATIVLKGCRTSTGECEVKSTGETKAGEIVFTDLPMKLVETETGKKLGDELKDNKTTEEFVKLEMGKREEKGKLTGSCSKWSSSTSLYGKYTAEVVNAAHGELELKFPAPGYDELQTGGGPVTLQGSYTLQLQTALNDATQTIYYTAAANSSYPGCGEHPEWAGLACQTQPAKQPETSGLPNLPVTTVTYNAWDEPEKTTETSGSNTRTTTDSYDAAGRLLTTSISSTVGTALPTVTDEYNKETGTLEKQSTTTEGKTKTITSVLNSLGQLTSYTDADGNTTTYEYEKEKDTRLKKINDGKGTETFTYSETTGLPIELVNEYGTSKLAFTATYDTEGNMLTEDYPNGMDANYTYNAVGRPTGLEYIKTTHCTEKCTWFSDNVLPAIDGHWLSQTSTLSSENYTYDKAGRLTEVQDTPAGKGCITRIYSYDVDTNRTSLTTREPGSKGECTTTGGTVEKHTYDVADRLTDTGTSYDAFGNTTALPASDAGGSELTSTYYDDNQLASQTQNGQTIGYNLDPAGRTLETLATGKRAEDTIQHYAGPGNTPTWTENTSGETTRNIPGINGSLAATQSNSETPVLQLTNLHGDIIATAYLSETATGLASTADTTEYGVPTTSLPPKYSWLGALQIPTELPSGVVAMGARSYIPQLGRFLQTDPLPGGADNTYTYTNGDPINESDPTGDATQPPAWLTETSQQVADEGVERRLAEERAAREEAERKAREADEAAARQAAFWASHITGYYYDLPSGPTAGGEEEEWYEEEWYEEEGEWEYISNHHGGTEGHEEPRLESGVLYQPLLSEQPSNEATTGVVPLCEQNTTGTGSNCSRDAGGVGHSHGKKLVRALEHDGSNQGSVCDGVSTLIYFVPGLGEIRGAAGLLLLGAC
jgi:RHS repeat-associated protein